ncbi:hypothetical protein JCM11641_003087 [Rhodosporidiobolus odoratus]
MCHSTSVLFHGFIARTISLVTAAEAWQSQLRSQLLVIAIFCTRRKDGTLAVVQSKTRLPEVPRRGLAADQGGTREDGILRGGGLRGSLRGITVAIKGLLADFGLVLSRSYPIVRHGPLEVDMNCLSLISLPLSSPLSGSSFLSAHQDIQHHSGEPVTSTLAFGPAVFASSPDCARRFRLFCLTFPLLELEHDTPHITPDLLAEAPGPQSSGNEKNHKEKGKRQGFTKV